MDAASRNDTPNQRIAVVGAGVSGLTTAALLAYRHRVTLFESEARLGGHAHTFDVELEGRQHPVDTGFMVCNDRTYPNFLAMLESLGVALQPSDMSFSVSLAGGRFEWAGSNNPLTAFAQPANALKPAFWSMLRDLFRFNREASRLAESPERIPDITLADYLDQNRYGAPFRERYLVPMAASIWSTPAAQIGAFPLATFLLFCRNHGLLAINGRPQWLTLVGGARAYVQKLAAQVRDIRLETPVLAVSRGDADLQVVTRNGTERYDQIVLACHTDQALALIQDADREERRMLAGIPYQMNRAVLHTDHRFMPKRRAAWAAWNFHAGEAAAREQPVSLTYWLNRLQSLPFETPLMVTLNPEREPGAGSIYAQFEYAHPVYTMSSTAAQASLEQLQGHRRTWFAGAWTRYGFHEDGVRSALAIANALGVKAPWQK